VGNSSHGNTDRTVSAHRQPLPFKQLFLPVLHVSSMDDSNHCLAQEYEQHEHEQLRIRVTVALLIFAGPMLASSLTLSSNVS